MNSHSSHHLPLPASPPQWHDDNNDNGDGNEGSKVEGNDEGNEGNDKGDGAYSFFPSILQSFFLQVVVQQ